MVAERLDATPDTGAKPMKLYDMVKAPNPRRVRIFLAEKGVTIETVEVDIPGGANLGSDYLAINPRGVVPTLALDDSSVIDESIAICRYIDALHPEPNLFGREPLEIARVEQWQRRCDATNDAEGEAPPKLSDRSVVCAAGRCVADLYRL